ncbi:MAG: AI-2E family transporter [Lautropia sp.]
MSTADAGAPARAFADRVLVVLGMIVVLLLAWQLADAFTLVFGGLVLATVLRAVSGQVQAWTGVPGRVALALSLLCIVVVLALAGWLVGDRVAGQVDALRDRLPAAVDASMAWLRSNPIGQQLISSTEAAFEDGVPWDRLGAAAGLTLGALGNIVLMVVLGIYLAADPGLYRRGIVRLVARRHRERVADALSASGEGLAKWLLGQGISMLFVGSATALGLALLDMPLALSLGLIAGLLDFVPFFGPIASGLLATLLAFAEGPSQALYVAALAIIIQFIEGNVLLPIVQRRAVSLPPVLGLMAVVVFGGLFGLVGVVFATPMMVVLMIAIRRLYVDGVLESPSIARSSASPGTGLTRNSSKPDA